MIYFGPPFFILYMNDFISWAEESIFNNFAYARTLFVKNELHLDLADTNYNELHKDLKKLQIDKIFLSFSNLFFTVFFGSFKAYLPDFARGRINLIHSPTTTVLGTFVENKVKIFSIYHTT